MASIRKIAKGFRADIARKGVRKTKVFASKQEAKDWAARQEYLILNAEDEAVETTFGEVLDRYNKEANVADADKPAA